MPLQGDEPIGPFPAGVDPVDYDKLRRRVFWTMPSGLFVVGARAGDRLNGMTANWCTQVSSDPKLLAVSVEHEALTHALLHEGRVFSLCIIDRDDRAIVRKFTKPVDVDRDAKTLNGFPYFERTTGAPILAQSVAWLDCEVRQEIAVGSHTLFIGEVVNCGFGAGFPGEEDRAPLRMEDTRMNYGG